MNISALNRVVFMSDLHMEMREYSTSPFDGIDADLIILAGDIGKGTEGVAWAQRTFKCPVLYVAGNHEFFGHDFDLLIPEMRKACAGSHVTLLENESVVIDGIRYVGSTLWTDFCINGRHQQLQAIENSDCRMADYQVIKRGDKRLHPLDTIHRHEASKTYLAKELARSSEPVIIISHHSPSRSTVSPRYAAGELTPAFASNLESLFRSPLLAWIYGHNHDSKIWAINQIPLISNQWGYPTEWGMRFKKNQTIGAVLETIRRYRDGEGGSPPLDG